MTTSASEADKTSHASAEGAEPFAPPEEEVVPEEELPVDELAASNHVKRSTSESSRSSYRAGLLPLVDVAAEVEAASALASNSSTSGDATSTVQMLAVAVNGPASNASEPTSRIATNRGRKCVLRCTVQLAIATKDS